MTKLRLASLIALLLLCGSLAISVPASAADRSGQGFCSAAAPMSADGVPTIWPTGRRCL